jgi:glycosyltransferase involved in cell wall biosynthesis
MAKVLFIGNYGVSLNVNIAEVELMIGLKKKGVEIEVLSDFSKEIEEILNKEEITTHSIKLPNKIDRKFISKVKQLQADNDYDIIHCYHNRILRNVVIAVKKNSVKLITYLGLSSVYWHDPFAHLSFLHARVDKIICNSKFVLNHLKKQLWGKNKKKAVLIYKGYDPSWFKEIEPFDLTSLNIPPDATIVSIASTFMKRKGINYLVESINFLPESINVHYILMGTNTDNEKVKKWVLNTGFQDRFHLLGYREDVKSIIKASDIYVQSSLKEGFGRSLSEAVSMGIPVITTDTGGFAEILEHKKSGMIIPIKSAKAIADSILYLKNKETRKAIGKEGKKILNRDITLQNTIEETYKLYHTVLTEK